MKYVVLVIIAFSVFFYLRSSNKNTKAAIENIAIGQTFLTQNKAVEDVIETDSGLQYQVLQRGKGTEHPSASTKVTVHYHGTLLDGTVFDSSVDRDTPISFGLNQVISVWTGGVQLMVECLLVLKEKGINMCKLESRPIQGRPWEEMFYIDVEANLTSFALQEAISEMTEHTHFIKVLGCYPIEHISPTSVPSSAIV